MELLFVKTCKSGLLQEATRLYLEHSDLDVATFRTAFRRACENDHLAIAQWLLLVKPTIHILAHNDHAFHWACYRGHFVAQWLLSVKPDIDVSAKNDCAFRFALELAAEKQDANLVFGEGDDVLGATDGDTSLLNGLIGDTLLPGTITRSDLQAKMAKIPSRFCFIKCLHAYDQETFVDAYIDVINNDNTQLEYYEKGVIKVSTWLDIMRGLELQYNYRVYRYAYWGENSEIKVVSQKKAHGYKSMLIEFGSEHVGTINLLIADRHISRIYLFRRCSFVNVDQWFWDKIMGYDTYCNQ